MHQVALRTKSFQNLSRQSIIQYTYSKLVLFLQLLVMEIEDERLGRLFAELLQLLCAFFSPQRNFGSVLS